MNLLGIHLTLLIGPTVPLPAPVPLLEALESVEVTHSDQDRSGFQLTFRVERSGLLDLLDYKLLSLPSLRPGSRVILIVTFNALPRVLMDGFITHQELQPGQEAGSSMLTVTGEDVSLKMDLAEKVVEHPAQNEMIVANKIIASYSPYGLIPTVIPPPVSEAPNPIEWIPGQQDTDLGHLSVMAFAYGYVFYVTPGPVPGVNTAYWGPAKRLGLPQKALSTNLGPHTNVEALHFQHNTMAPQFVEGWIQDAKTNLPVPIQTFASTRSPLASQPTWVLNYLNMRRTQFHNNPHLRRSALSAMQAYAYAQAMTDASMDGVVTATGTLDALSYGDILQARGLVGVRGAGYTYDGMYYVKKVTHTIQKGAYKQNFTLAREGVGSLTPVVRP